MFITDIRLKVLETFPSIWEIINRPTGFGWFFFYLQMTYWRLYNLDLIGFWYQRTINDLNPNENLVVSAKQMFVLLRGGQNDQIFFFTYGFENCSLLSLIVFKNY